MPAPSKPEIHEQNYRFLQQHVYAETGIVLENNKHYLFESRLQPIVRRLGLANLDELCALLQTSREPDVGRQVVEAMATNETYFFRDPWQYEAIRAVLVPRLMSERAATRKMRFWSAASSTGQEAYSLAMLLAGFPLGSWDIHILATDISSQVLERARSGRFLQVEVNRGLPPALLQKHFRPADLDWQLSSEIRRMVSFRRADLREPAGPGGPFDLIFCRNVMIYFDAATKKQILRELRRALVPGGWLFLGAAETAHGFERWFERKLIDNATIFIAR
ncbi:protein-glutamate O-methyltransferase CheR [Acidobacteria bacterium AB60]|nr:protein-glutamate O-methyltransferase CheR [Acidobacteria bacterium AB60]